jgi:hypothetical protein
MVALSPVFWRYAALPAPRHLPHNHVSRTLVDGPAVNLDFCYSRGSIGPPYVGRDVVGAPVGNLDREGCAFSYVAFDGVCVKGRTNVALEVTSTRNLDGRGVDEAGIGRGLIDILAHDAHDDGHRDQHYREGHEVVPKALFHRLTPLPLGPRQRPLHSVASGVLYVRLARNLHVSLGVANAASERFLR